MGNCGGSQKDMEVGPYMQKYHPPTRKVDLKNHELNKKLIAGLNGNTITSEIVEVKPMVKDGQAAVEERKQLKKKIDPILLDRFAKLTGKSSTVEHDFG